MKPSLKIFSSAVLATCTVIAQPVVAGQVADHVLPEGWTLSGSNQANYDVGIATVQGAPGKSVFIKSREPAELDATKYNGPSLDELEDKLDQARERLQERLKTPDKADELAAARKELGEVSKQLGQARARYQRYSFRANWGGFVTVMQTIAADSYVGKRLQLSATLKTDDAQGAQLWMRMDGDDPNPLKNVLNFYNMDDRPITGTTNWARYNVVLDVPDKTKVIAFGFLLKGQGEVWANGIKLEEVPKTVRASAMPNNPLPKAPVNLNFER